MLRGMRGGMRLRWIGWPRGGVATEATPALFVPTGGLRPPETPSTLGTRELVMLREMRGGMRLR